MGAVVWKPHSPRAALRPPPHPPLSALTLPSPWLGPSSLGLVLTSASGSPHSMFLSYWVPSSSPSLPTPSSSGLTDTVCAPHTAFPTGVGGVRVHPGSCLQVITQAAGCPSSSFQSRPGPPGPGRIACLGSLGDLHNGLCCWHLLVHSSICHLLKVSRHPREGNQA